MSETHDEFKKPAQVTPFPTSDPGRPADRPKRVRLPLSRTPIREGDSSRRRSHGFFSRIWSREEIQKWHSLEESLAAEKGNPSIAERALIKIASRLYCQIERAFRALERGEAGPDMPHFLASINSFRLLLCALGLERRTRELPLSKYIEKLLYEESMSDSE